MEELAPKLFDYTDAFSRNIGFLSREEQSVIKSKTIAIPGMGGVGGHHLHTLVRLGFEKFHIADFDEFDVHNFNRQIGAKMSTVGRQKADVMRDMIKDINPNAQIKVFSEGVNESNYDEFLKGIDILVDGLDIFAIKPRLELFAKADQLNIPIVTAAPLGMGTSLLAFDPKKMGASEYFNIDRSLSTEELMIRFLVGVAPKLVHDSYMIRKEVDIFKGRVPSLHVGCLAATSALGSIVLKIALDRGDVIYAPHGFHVDFYLNKYKYFWRPFGNKNPLQKLAIAYLKRKFAQSV